VTSTHSPEHSRGGRSSPDLEPRQASEEEARLIRMPLNTDQAESDRIIDEALAVALMTTRLLGAWHSGSTDAQDAMHLLWDGFCKIRSASGSRLECDETQRRSQRRNSPCDGQIRPSGPQR
jgi:hypothetical protein